MSRLRTSRNALRLCGALAVVVGWCPVAAAGPPVAVTHSIDENTTRYSVTAEGLGELYARMDLKKPEVLDGAEFDAYTRWRIAWNIHSADTEEGCDGVSLALSIETILPHWDVGRGVPYTDERESWDRYLEALTEHEEAHARLARQSIRQLERRIGALPADRCRGIERTVEDLGQNVVARGSAAEIELDKRTEHGRSNGAVRP